MRIHSFLQTNLRYLSIAKINIHAYIYNYIHNIIYICCYHRSSVNIAFGVSRSELTKPGDQSMAGFDFINKYHQKWWSEHGWTWSHRSIHIEMNYQIVIRFYVFNLILPQHRDDLMFSIWFYLNIVMHLIKPD